jgi:two-component system chemotaxis sensor kinase CheA
MGGEDESLHAEEEPRADLTAAEYLLVDVAGRQAAVPLADVLRIEQIPVSRIEWMGCRPVINFAGQLVPVEDGGRLVERAQAKAEAQIILVICREGTRHVGIAVSHVLDVAAGGQLFEAGTNQLHRDVTLLRNRVTSVVDVGAIAEAATREWNEFAERVG